MLLITCCYINIYVLGKSSYNVPSAEDQIKSEIMKLGPVEACFDVYEDFLTYKSGTRLTEGFYNLNFASEDLIMPF